MSIHLLLYFCLNIEVFRSLIGILWDPEIRLVDTLQININSLHWKRLKVVHKDSVRESCDIVFSLVVTGGIEVFWFLHKWVDN